MCKNGEGVPHYKVQAHKWFNLLASSAAFDDLRKSGTRNRNIVAAQMTPKQIAEAQRLAGEWVPTE